MSLESIVLNDEQKQLLLEISNLHNKEVKLLKIYGTICHSLTCDEYPREIVCKVVEERDDSALPEFKKVKEDLEQVRKELGTYFEQAKELEIPSSFVGRYHEDYF